MGEKKQESASMVLMMVDDNVFFVLFGWPRPFVWHGSEAYSASGLTMFDADDDEVEAECPAHSTAHKHPTLQRATTACVW